MKKMEIHILIDREPYEATTIIAAYSDRAQALSRMANMKRQRDGWIKKQRRLEEAGSERAWDFYSPHTFDNLEVISLNVKQSPPAPNLRLKHPAEC